MKAVFSVKTIKSDWAPPFRKDIRENEYTASTEEEFDIITGNGNNEAIFKVIEIKGDKVTIQFSNLFTLKNPSNDRENTQTNVVDISKGEEKIIAYLWGERGITKKITFKGTSSEAQKTQADEKEETPEPVQEKQETEEKSTIVDANALFIPRID